MHSASLHFLSFTNLLGCVLGMSCLNGINLVASLEHASVVSILINYLLFISVSYSSFYAFRGLTYGMSGPVANQPNATQAAYKWLDSWEI